MSTRNAAPKSAPASYAVGYGKPPAHTRFQKGKSANPGGRPRRGVAEQAKALALKEAYRKVTVQDGEDTQRMPVIQAILRNQLALAAKGNVAAQRAVLGAVQAIELENAQAAALEASKRPEWTDLTYREAARRIGLLLRLGEEEEQEVKAAQAAQSTQPAQAAPAAQSAPPAGDAAPAGAWKSAAAPANTSGPRVRLRRGGTDADRPPCTGAAMRREFPDPQEISLFAAKNFPDRRRSGNRVVTP
jgi:hypothetical protein